MKPIRLSNHALGYLRKRGFSVEEVNTAIESAEWSNAEVGSNRMQCSMEYRYGGSWNGQKYGTKQVKPIFVEEEAEIVVITVYTYYY